MSLITIVAEAAHTEGGLSPFIPAGIAFGVLLLLGIVTWSYRDVANRHSHKTSAHDDSHGAGH